RDRIDRSAGTLHHPRRGSGKLHALCLAGPGRRHLARPRLSEIPGSEWYGTQSGGRFPSGGRAEAESCGRGMAVELVWWRGSAPPRRGRAPSPHDPSVTILCLLSFLLIQGAVSVHVLHHPHFVLAGL